MNWASLSIEVLSITCSIRQALVREKGKMIPSFIITFREVLEAALVVGIVLSYLVRTKQTQHNNIVYLGVASGIVASIVGAIVFTTIAGGFAGRAEKIFEGITMLVGAFLKDF
jgi:high-affinity iron transporter